MSWVVEEWKEGLPTRTLQKIRELEDQLDKLKKERQQRQFQLESLEAAFQKQKQKVESEKGEVTALKRENKSLIECCDSQEKTRQRMAHEQQMKDTQISLLEGQLLASKSQIEKLESELKKYKSEFERSQQSFTAMDLSLCGTPQKSLPPPFTPAKHSDSKYEELLEKYNKEVQERTSLEAELRLLQMRTVSQSSQPAPPSAMNHRDIARHHTSSSVFSWHQDRTPTRVSTSSHDTSLKRSYGAMHSLWEQEETPSKRGFRGDTSNRSFSEPANMAATDQLKSQNQELRSRVTELEQRLQVQEKELKSHLNKIQETQAALEKTQAELLERDRAVTKSRDDLARVTAQWEQAADRCSQTEQKLKKVTEELSCQRQNAESARVLAENRLKERDKENQQELLRQQNSLKSVEQELNQTKARLSQESQQAKNEFNAIQLELDRATYQKKVLEGELEEQRQKLVRAQLDLQTSETQASNLQRKLEEAKSQQNVSSSQLDQRVKDIRKLEEQLKDANQMIQQHQQSVERLAGENRNLDAELKYAQQKLKAQDCSSLHQMKENVSRLEQERDHAQETLRKRQHEIDETKTTLAKLAEESQALKKQLDCKERECKELTDNNLNLAKQKSEHENKASQFFRQEEGMLAKLKESENVILSHKREINSLEREKEILLNQLEAMKELEKKQTADLEAQKQACLTIQQELDSKSQTYQKDVEHLRKSREELVEELKLQFSSASRVLHLESDLEKQTKLNVELQSKHEELLQSKMDVQNQLSELQKTHERFVSESQRHIESLQDNITSKQSYADSVSSAIRDKEEEICVLSEKLKLASMELQSACESNRDLNAKVQELTLQSESWSKEKESLTALIRSNQKEIEKLIEESKQINDLSNSLNHEKAPLHKVEADPCHLIDQHEENVLDFAERMDEECTMGIDKEVKECENLQVELAELKEKLCKTEEDNSRLLRANEELSTLVGQVRSNEQSLDKIVEDLRMTLKDRETSIKKLEAKLELLKMDIETVSVPVEGGKTSISGKLETPSGDVSCVQPRTEQEKLFSSQCQKERENPVGIAENQTMLVEEKNASFAGGNESRLLNLSGELFPSFLEPRPREENETLLLNLDQLTLTSADDVTKSLSHLLELDQNRVQQAPSLSPFSSPPVKENRGTKEGRKSISSLIVDLILQQPDEEQQVLFSGLSSEETFNAKDLLTVYQMELSTLRKQHLDDIAAWQQKLHHQASEMETKLVEEKARSDRLTQELEAAKLDLQVLDLSARSLLFDGDDLTTRVDASNQSLCTFVPIGRLSLGNSEAMKCESLKQGQGSPENKSSEENSEDTSKNGVEEANGNRRSARQKRKKANTVDNPKTQEVSEQPRGRRRGSSNENEKLLLLVKDKEKYNQHLMMEIKELSMQIEIQKTELSIKEEQNKELENKANASEAERSQLQEKIEAISGEQLQSSGRIEVLEKDLQATLTAMEFLKERVTELSKIREGLEISSEEWKENYLQAENELKRTKSERANIENHTRSLEADMDALQSKYQHLQQKHEAHLTSLNESKESLKAALAEKDQLTCELETLVEVKLELEQRFNHLKERETQLESNHEHAKELTKLLESDIHTLKEEIQAAKLTTTQLIEERDSLTLLRESENLQIQELQKEVQLIQEEREAHLKSLNESKESLKAALAEKDQLTCDLETLLEAKQELEQRYNLLNERETELESNHEHAKELTKLLESDIHTLKEEIQAAKLTTTQLIEERDSLTLLRESENLQIQDLQKEVQLIQEEREVHLKSLNESKEGLKAALAEKDQLTCDLETLLEAKQELEQRYNLLKERETELESNHEHAKELTKLLESDIHTLKEEIQAAKLTTTQLIEERDSLTLLRESDNLQIQDLQKEVQLIQEENQLLVREREELQTQLSAANGEKNEISRSLERCRVEKHEVATSLNSAQEEVALMRAGIEKLKVKIESDENKKRQTIEKLKESERKFDNLNDKIESLERELAMAEENFENAILQTETATEEAETLKSEKEALEEELNRLRRELVDLENELQNSRVKISELETSILTLTNTLETKESEHAHFRDSSEKELEMLQTQLNDLREQKALYDQTLEMVKDEHTNFTTKMEEERAQLLQQLEAAQVTSRDFKASTENLSLELEECRLQLAEKAQQMVVLETRAKEAEEKENAYSTELSLLKQESEKLKKDKENLLESLDDMIERVEGFSSDIETYEIEKDELTTSLKSAEEEVTLLHARIEALKREAELQEKNRNETTEELKESKRECDRLNDKIESLQRELAMLEKNLETAILDTETSKEEAERLKSEKEYLQEELSRLRENLPDLEKELQNSQARIEELETTIHNLTLTLETKETEQAKLKDTHQKELEIIQTQLNQLLEQKAFTDQSCETVGDEHDISSEKEEERFQLLQQLEEAQVATKDLKVNAEKLLLEIEEYKSQLAEKTKNLVALEARARDTEEMEIKYSTELSRLEMERETLTSEKINLMSRLEEMEAKLQMTSTENESLQAIISELRTSHSGLETHLELITSEKKSLLGKAAELEDNCSVLRSKLQESDLHIKTAQEQSCQEKTVLEEVLQTLRQQREEDSARLLAATSEATELKGRVAALQNDLESHAGKYKEERDLLLVQAESHHKVLLEDILKQHKEETDGYQRKLAAVEAHLTELRQEMDSLRATNTEVTSSLCQAQEQLHELKVRLDHMTKEKETVRGKLSFWVSSCKQMEHEKEELKTLIAQQEETMKNMTHKQEHEGDDDSAEDLLSEIAELKQILEEKSQEADDSVEKYCNLMIKTHKLEDSNDCLMKQVDMLSSKLREYEQNKEAESVPPAAPQQPLAKPEKRRRSSRRSTQGPAKQANKRQRESDNTGSAPATPQGVTKKVRKAPSTMEVEEPYEPDGLPEVVKKGFSDIPSGKQSPFVLRRAAVPLRQSPRLASQTNSPSPHATQNENQMNLAHFSSPAAGGSKLQKGKTEMGPDSKPTEVQSPLSTNKMMNRRRSEASAPNRMDMAVLHDDSEEEGTCQVQ
ncbi:centromere protein F [Hyperolius riggenbachi]|uniref:centromere protein F n=1 Tax=Hyperolius riggenbachi TaxID=752182 RepID=UPI0035A2D7B5